MRIDPAAALHAALLGLVKGKSAGQAPAFRSDGAAGSSPPVTATLTAATATSSVAMLVAMASPPHGPTRSPALRRAGQGIEALDRLRRLLAAGALPDDALQALREWTGEEVEAGDEQSRELLHEVELRILVELAKAGR